MKPRRLKSETMDTTTTFTGDEHKGLELKAVDGDKGEVIAQIAKFDEEDKDGDVTLTGFFGEQKSSILQAHKRQEWAVGRGEVFEADGAAMFKGQFNLGMAAGREGFESVKFQAELQEWSYGYLLKSDGFRMGEHKGSQVRFLIPNAKGEPGARVYEVSPVVVGAGNTTGTVSVKAGSRFVDELAELKDGLAAAIRRAEEIAEMRSEKGKTLGQDVMASLSALDKQLGTLREQIAKQLEPVAEPDTGKQLTVADFMESQHLLARAQLSAIDELLRS